MTKKIRERVKTATISKLLATYLLLDVLFSLARSNLLAVVASTEIIQNVDSILFFLPIVLPGFSSEITTIEHLIAIWIFVLTTRRISNQVGYFPQLQERAIFCSVVAVQWLLFIYFLILLGSPTPALLRLSIENQWVVLLALWVVSWGVPLTILLYFDFLSRKSQKIQLREILTAITLFPAALAIIFDVGPFLEFFVLLGLLLNPFSKLLGWKIDIEQRLLHLLTRLEDGERGFSLGMVILTGLYLASSAENLLRTQLTFLYTFISYPTFLTNYPPFLFGLILAVAIVVFSTFLWTSLAFSDWKNKAHRNPLLIGSGILIAEGIAIAHLSGFVANSEFSLSLSNPVVFAISFSICIVLIAESRHYGAPEYLIVVQKIVAAFVFVPVYLRSEIVSVFPMITLPAFVYYLAPVIRKFIWRTTKTGSSESPSR